MIEFTDETSPLLSQHPDWVRDQITKGITLRRQAKNLESEASAIKEQANGLLSMAMKAAKIDKVESVIGNVTLKSNTRSNLNTNKLKEVLVTKGVDPKVVADSVEEAMSKTEYESVEFREAKKSPSA